MKNSRAVKRCGYRQYGLEILEILFGSILFSLSMWLINSIYIIPGNIIGIARILNILFQWKIGCMNLLINIPVMIIGVYTLGRKTFIYTCGTLMATSVFTDILLMVFPSFDLHVNIIVLILFASVLMGTGCGILFRGGATTGGTTMIARMIGNRFRKLKIGSLMILMDGIIITFGAALLKKPAGLFYSILFEIAVCQIINIVVYGFRNKCKI